MTQSTSVKDGDVAPEFADDGGPAFPQPAPNVPDGMWAMGSAHPGMSRRDWFAGQALVVAMAHGPLVALDPSSVARLAYEIADAMIARSAEG